MLWKTFIQNRVKASSGWFYLNQQIAYEAQSYSEGFYIYTDRRRWLENKNKVGQTKRGEQRLFEQGADQDEDYYILGFIHLDLTGLGDYDKTIHKHLERKFDCKRIKKETASGYTEWLEFPIDVEPVGTVRDAVQDHKNDKNAGRTHLQLTKSQRLALEDALEQFEKGNVMLADLCPRFGKTIWSLVLFDHLTEDVMVTCSYVLTALISHKNDVGRFFEFEHMAIADNLQQVEENRKNGLKSIILVSLHDSFNVWKQKYGWIKNVGNHWVFVDEADFGAHQPPQVKKVKFLADHA